MVAPNSRLLPNTILQNRYRIIRQLGEGGMGAIYLAFDQRLGGNVALKESFFSQDQGLRRQFEREAQLVANLRHSGLPKVIDHFTEQDRQFLVMEFITGEDLDHMLRQRTGPFPIEQVLGWAHQLLNIIDYLHTRNPPIIHRDIKPQNLKLADTGELILLDFGLAKGTLSQRTYLTSGSSIFGYTASYAPPEQIHGTGTDSRSDIYSVGATLYHLLTGVCPVTVSERAVALAIGLPDPLLPANDINPQIPQTLASVLKQSMALNRDQRPPGAAHFRLQLSGAMSSGPETKIATAPARPATDKAPTAKPRPMETPYQNTKPGALDETILINPITLGNSYQKTLAFSESEKQFLVDSSIRPKVITQIILLSMLGWAASFGLYTLIALQNSGGSMSSKYAFAIILQSAGPAVSSSGFTLGFFLSTILIGLILGATQWLFLRKHIATDWWLIITAITFSVFMILTHVLLPHRFGWETWVEILFRQSIVLGATALSQWFILRTKISTAWIWAISGLASAAVIGIAAGMSFSLENRNLFNFLCAFSFHDEFSNTYFSNLIAYLYQGAPIPRGPTFSDFLQSAIFGGAIIGLVIGILQSICLISFRKRTA